MTTPRMLNGILTLLSLKCRSMSDAKDSNKRRVILTEFCMCHPIIASMIIFLDASSNFFVFFKNSENVVSVGSFF